jgi:serine/threonine-protein kinase
MSLVPGAHIGPYEILSAFRAGGMGDVNRAKDTKPHRDVAIKVLPGVFASDSEASRYPVASVTFNHPTPILFLQH